MDTFAHNGVHHQTVAEAVTHSLPEIILITILVTALVAGLMGSAIFVLQKFSVIELPVKEKEQNK